MNGYLLNRNLHLNLNPSVEIFRLDDPLAFLEERADFTASPIEIDSALV